VFLSRPISAKDVPGIEGGKAKDDTAAWSDADARLVALLSDRELPGDKSMGAFVGTLEGIKLASGWSIAADDAQLRAAFEIAPAETAIVVVDREGRLAMRERGRIAFWQLSSLNELLSLPPRRASN
jgi:hypothetical protein